MGSRKKIKAASQADDKDGYVDVQVEIVILVVQNEKIEPKARKEQKNQSYTHAEFPVPSKH